MKGPIEFRHSCWLIRKWIGLENGGVCVTRTVNGPALYEIRQKARGAALFAFMMPAVSTPRGVALQRMCRNNLRQIAHALHSYHDDFGVFPPAYTVDGQDRPLHSWRTLILPYLGEEILYDSIDLTKPWNDPANAGGREASTEIYVCPSSNLPDGLTTYLGNTAARGVFRPEGSRRISEMTDGTTNTILVIDVPSAGAVHWMAPFDDDGRYFLSFDAETEVAYSERLLCVFVDGSTMFFDSDLPGPERQALMTAAGDEEVSW